MEGEAIGRLSAAANRAAATRCPFVVLFVTRKKPRKGIPNQKSALRIGREGEFEQKMSLKARRGGRRGGCLAKLGGEQNSGGTIFLFHFASRGLTFTIGWVYDDDQV